jgi:hypothetical protein
MRPDRAAARAASRRWSYTGITAALMGFQHQFRHLEAYAAAHLYSVVAPTIAAPSTPIIWFGLGAPGAFGLVVTPNCSSALLVAPLCVLGIALLISRKLAVDRVMKALTVVALVLVTGNLIRIGVIVAAIRMAGIDTGYQVGHPALGSLVSIICIAVSLILLTVIVVAPDDEALWAPLLRWYRRADS